MPKTKTKKRKRKVWTENDCTCQPNPGDAPFWYEDEEARCPFHSPSLRRSFSLKKYWAKKKRKG